MADLSVSVVIPTFNRAGLVGRAIRSVIANIEPGDEIIVIDDGSTDDTPAVLRTFGERIRAVRQDNAGAAIARNHGIRLATNPLVAFLDSDDEWMPGKLALQRALMAARPDLVYTFTNFAITTASGRTQKGYLSEWLSLPMSWADAIGPSVSFTRLAPLPSGATDVTVYVGDHYKAELIEGYVLTSSAVVRRDLAGDTLRFADDLVALEDWYCFARMARQGPVAFIDRDYAWQHGHSGERLTDIDPVRYHDCRKKVIERIWAEDPDLGRRDPELLARLTSIDRLFEARALLWGGHAREARRLFAEAYGASPTERALAWLPGVAAKLLGRSRRTMKSYYKRVLAAFPSRQR